MKQLRERFDRLTEQHEKTRSQLARSLAEVARLRGQRETDERARLEQERMEVQRARLQYIAKERQTGLLRDRSELESIKETLQRMALGAPADPTSGMANQGATLPWLAADSEASARRREALFTEPPA